MTYKVSTGLRNHMLVTGSLKNALDLGFIKIYTGAPPASADDAVTGTLLCTVSVTGGGTGLSLDTSAVDGVVSKPAAVVWKGTNAATGTAGYYRHVAVGDTGVSSATEKRVQGAISASGAEMNFSSVALVSGAEQTIDFYSIALPTF